MSVGLLGNVNKLFYGRRVDFLILRCNEKSSNSQKLNLVFLNAHADTEEPVDQIDSNEQCLGEESKLHMHLNDPINQCRSHVFTDR